MTRSPFPRWLLAGLLGVLFGGATLPAAAAATLTQQIDPPEASVGDAVTVTFTVQNGSQPSIQLPRVDGLPIARTSSSTNIVFSNGTLSSALAQSFTLVPQRPGDFTIPAFDIQTQDGQVLHARAMKLHVMPAGAAVPQSPPTFQPNGGGGGLFPPMPSGNAPRENESQADSGIKPPMEGDGRPAKAFMVITPKTTDAYVGETIPLRIEFYLRQDSIAQQDSLPTIKGSDFLMNDLSVRPAEDMLIVQGEAYHRETWLTAISASRSGDFSLEMERDTYWNKNGTNIFSDPLGNFFGRRSNLAHGIITSNKFVVHAHSTPDEGRPADFSGAIGQFKAIGNASPTTVNVGDPVYLDFSITGEGNFNSVRAPALAPDPAWKSYAPSSQIHFADETRTQGNKSFHEAIIPKQNGVLPLPAARFSYFDPTTKKYVTIPLSLPPITVTGTPAAPDATPATQNPLTTAPAVPTAPDLVPNRLELGALQSNLTPLYDRPWFWISQGALLALALVAALGLYLRSRRRPDLVRAEYALRRRSLQEVEAAMSLAAQNGDAPGFFLAARRAVQLRWAAEWRLPTEAVTLPEIAERDPQLAEAVTPLFQQADEVMYSGQAPGDLDLAEWEHRVRTEMLQLAAS